MFGLAGGAAKRRGKRGPVLFTPPSVLHALVGRSGGEASRQLFFDIVSSVPANVG